MALLRGNPAHLLPPGFKHQVSLWLEEDCPGFDVGGFVVGDKASEAKLLGKSAVCGFFFFSCSSSSSSWLVYRSVFLLRDLLDRFD
jgi:hypothetical protein